MSINIIVDKYVGIDVNSCMNVSKCFAIISVIMAHSRNTGYYFYSNITERFGSLGVITFLLIAGYYFNVKKYGVKVFFLNKINTIIIPWLFTGTIVFFVSNKANDVFFTDWINWILGNGTYLYYLTILLLCYLILSFFDKKAHLILFIVGNIISLLATSLGMLDYLFLKYFKIVEINNYLNIFNWIGYFSIGVLLKGHLNLIMEFLRKYCLLVVITYVLILTMSFYVEPNYAGYFSKLAIPLQLLGVVFILSIPILVVLSK